MLKFLLSFFVFTNLALAAPEVNALDELDPFDPRIEQILQEFDQIYEEETGQSPYLTEPFSLFRDVPSCIRDACEVWAQVVKSLQMMYLYEQGELVGKWKVSTGVKGRSTPNFDSHPDGRIYDRYTSAKYPGGDYKNLGNMPYAVFIRGGFAIHGTGEVNWKKLGNPASHGCIRLHPDNAFIFNRMVRKAGIRGTWITVQD